MNRNQKIEFILQGVNNEKTFIAMSLCNRDGLPLPPFIQLQEEKTEMERIRLKLNESSDQVLDEIINRINKV